MARDPTPTRRAARRPSHRASAARNVLGLMAGTSGDGIDGACVRIEGVGEGMKVRLLWHRHEPFRPALRRRLLSAMAPAETTTEEIARLHADLGDAFAAAAERSIRAARPAERPSLIGLAGQTVCHLPGRRGRTVTLQLGEAARVAARVGLATVSDFRQSDVAAGGQGAPLVPWTDWVLFRHPRTGRAVQNIGGIGNVTWIPAGAGSGDVIAFDTGPGNMVIDELVARATRGRARMDRGGRRAAAGRVLHGVLAAWLEHPFLNARPPKTTGRETFGRTFVEGQMERLRTASRVPNDWIATATAFTARSIGRAYRRFLAGLDQSEVIVAGGGAENATLMAALAAELPGTPVRSIGSAGIPAQAKEAVSFAMLAAACLDRVPANLPQATGAAHPAVLGRVILP